MSNVATEQEVRRTIPKEWSVGWLIIRLLNAKAFDPAEPVISAEGTVCRYEDGKPVTFGDLQTFIPAAESGIVNAKGEPVNNYAEVWDLTWPEAKGARDWLLTKSDDPAKKQNRPKGGGRSKAASPKATTPKAEPASPVDIGAIVAAEVAKALAGLIPAKPEPVAGFAKGRSRKVEVPAEPETAEEIAEAIAEGDFKSGDVIRVNGVAVQISTDGKRLNKTIV